MKIKQLIEKLKEYDENLPVCIANVELDELGIMWHTEYELVEKIEKRSAPYYGETYHLESGEFVAIY